MSFGNVLKNFGAVQEALVLGLMIVSVFALFYTDIDFTYKIGIAVLVFAIIFLASLASQLLRQQKEAMQSSKQ
jgi:hypothetical protein